MELDLVSWWHATGANMSHSSLNMLVVMESQMRQNFGMVENPGWPKKAKCGELL